jgi:hypothetical protein
MAKYTAYIHLYNLLDLNKDVLKHARHESHSAGSYGDLIGVLNRSYGDRGGKGPFVQMIGEETPILGTVHGSYHPVRYGFDDDGQFKLVGVYEDRLVVYTGQIVRTK